jgi:hypothetical protein
MQLKRDSTVAITTFILNTDLFYGFLLITVLFRLTQMAQMIVIAASGDFCYYQKQFYRMFLP